MPIENERKYVLKLEPSRLLPEIFWAPESERLPELHMYDQWYLTDSVRIRRCSNHVGVMAEDFFTFKKVVNRQTVEIECVISPEDFDKLKSIADKGLSKCRLVIDVPGYTWEVDFFVPPETEGIPFKERVLHSHLIMAEVELDEDEEEPYELPNFISDNLVYTVPHEDHRFKSSSLTDPQTARKLYDSLINTDK